MNNKGEEKAIPRFKLNRRTDIGVILEKEGIGKLYAKEVEDEWAGDKRKSFICSKTKLLKC